MKLAEALQQRADLNTRIAQLRARLDRNATVQEGEKTPEDPAELLKELNLCLDQLQDLIGRINLTNSATVVEGKTLTEWIAEKDVLTLRVAAYHSLVAEASNLTNRMSRNEIKILSAVNVKELQKEVDSLSATLRRVDNRIQQTNWTTELN